MGPLSTDWKRWTYFEWNQRLAAYVFDVRGPGDRHVSIERISSTPEELGRLAGAASTLADHVVDAFIDCVRHELRPGQGFCDYCLAYDWDPDDYPPFFAMLWFTCLIAYGYPDCGGSFGERLSSALGKAENFHSPGAQTPCLPCLWRSVASWSEERHRFSGNIKRLILRHDVGRRTVIGYSHFLAFPNRFDRTKLATMLRDADLVGAEPPIRLLLDTLLRHKETFSTEFQEDLEDFLQEYDNGASDPRDSSFWRAIRQEAVAPTIPAAAEGPAFGTLVFANDDDGLVPLLAWPLDAPPPAGYSVEAFDDGLWGCRLIGPPDDRERASREAVGIGKHLGPRDRRLLNAGIVALRENDSGLFVPVSGEDVHGCRSAFVKETLASAFISSFGGISRVSLVPHWREVHACSIAQLDELPPALSGATSLLRTTELPSIAFENGISVSDGFLFAPPFLPMIRARGAVALRTQLPDGSWTDCVGMGEGQWRLPEAGVTPGHYLIEATWPVTTTTGIVHRTRTTSLRLRTTAVGVEFKGLPSGEFFDESCAPNGESALTSADEIPFTVTTDDSALSTDLVDFDATARFLGPGVGEMALTRRPAFDWLAIGPKNDPELVIYVGEPENPTPPRNARSPSPGDRRHWQKVWQVTERKRYCRVGQWRCIRWADAPSPVHAAWQRYRQHRVAATAEQCGATDLDTLSFVPAPKQSPDPRVRTLVDAVCALSAERRGLSYPVLSDLFSQLLGHEDVLLIRQLIRAWVEAGCVNEARHAVTGRMVYVARCPRLVLVRRGPTISASLVGLVSQATANQFAHTAGRLGLPIVELNPVNRWQPVVYRTYGDGQELEQLRGAMDFPCCLWLDWPDRDHIPEGLDAQVALGTLFTTTPPNSFVHDASWDWSLGTFVRGNEGHPEGVQLTRRMNRNQLRIYVVAVEGAPACWTFQRSWALLAAYERRGISPFVLNHRSGELKSVGRAPVHLPLPIARLCALIGDGTPGPIASAESAAYCYPLGMRLLTFIRRVIPGSWISDC